MSIVTHTHESLEDAATRCREKNDCTVRALAVVCRVDYEVARGAMLATGRKPRQGAFQTQWMHGAQLLGHELIDVQFLVKSRTFKTLERSELPKLFKGKRLIIDSCEHVAGWDGRRILDWASGGLKRVDGLYLAHKVRRF